MLPVIFSPPLDQKANLVTEFQTPILNKNLADQPQLDKEIRVHRHTQVQGGGIYRALPASNVEPSRTGDSLILKGR